MKIKNVRIFFILPLSLLLLNILEEIAVYRIQKSMFGTAGPGNHLLMNLLFITALIALFAIGFSLVGNMFAPWLEKTLEFMYKHMKKYGGAISVAVAYCIAIIFIFVLYYVVYIKGAQYLLPPAWR
jgi:hypothetical protein